MMPLPTAAQLAAMIDHSLLRPELTLEEVDSGCDLAAEHAVASVCVRPADVALAARRLEGTAVLTSTVVGFPHGSSATAVKVAEARAVVDAGAREVDMVLNVGRLRSRDLDYVEDEIAAVVRAAGVPVKVILETAYLSDPEKATACRISERAGAAFVKTSSGFAPGGATEHDIRLMRASVTPAVEVKAAGGVRDLDTLLRLHALGATRFGATVTAALMRELAERRTGAASADAPVRASTPATASLATAGREPTAGGY